MRGDPRQEAGGVDLLDQLRQPADRISLPGAVNILRVHDTDFRSVLDQKRQLLLVGLDPEVSSIRVLPTK